jgi:hypothetical protein
MGYLSTAHGSLGCCGLGDAAPAPTDPVAILSSQVNRFGTSAPSGYQYVTTPFLASGTVPLDLATVAITIYLRRATDSYNQFHDAGSAAAIVAANAGFASPVDFVTMRLADVTQTIGAFADSLGLPPAGGDAGGVPIWVIGVGLVAAWLVLNPSRKGR